MTRCLHCPFLRCPIPCLHSLQASRLGSFRWVIMWCRHMKICKYVRLVTCTLHAHICHICAMFPVAVAAGVEVARGAASGWARLWRSARSSPNIHGFLVLPCPLSARGRCRCRCRGCCSLVAHLICPTSDDNDMEIRSLCVLFAYPVAVTGGVY